MRPIIMLMLAVQVGIFLVTAYTIMFSRAAARNPQRPVWSGLAIALTIVAGASWNIAEKHAGQAGADILMYGSPLLLGMGLVSAFLQIRLRRGLDAPPSP